MEKDKGPVDGSSAVVVSVSESSSGAGLGGGVLRGLMASSRSGNVISSPLGYRNTPNHREKNTISSIY